MEIKRDFWTSSQGNYNNIKYTANGVNGFETGENAVWQFGGGSCCCHVGVTAPVYFIRKLSVHVTWFLRSDFFLVFHQYDLR